MHFMTMPGPGKAMGTAASWIRLGRAREFNASRIEAIAIAVTEGPRWLFKDVNCTPKHYYTKMTPWQKKSQFYFNLPAVCGTTSHRDVPLSEPLIHNLFDMTLYPSKHLAPPKARKGIL